jgi:probable phosphoglycerate mutase
VSFCTIHLLRHAEHAELGQELTGRRAGVPLSETGRQQAARAAEACRHLTIQRVLSSPVQRATETATAVAGVLGLAVVSEPGLEEIDFGGWTGQSFEALNAAPGWAGWNTARSLGRTPAGETMLAVQARAMASLWRQAEAGGTVLAVSHSDVIKAVLAHVLGMPLDLLHRLEVGPASRSSLVLGADWARVEAINLPP